MKTSVTIIGIPAVKARLSQITAQYLDKREAAVNAGALIVENDAKNRAPYLSGTLKRSIGHESVEKSAARVVVKVGTDLEYARIHEFGGKTGRGHAVTIKARPYLRPALDENRGKVKREIADALRDIT